MIKIISISINFKRNIKSFIQMFKQYQHMLYYIALLSGYENI